MIICIINLGLKNSGIIYFVILIRFSLLQYLY